MTQSSPRFPRIIRLHDGLDAMDEPNRRTLTLLWWGLGVLLVFCFAPHLALQDFRAAVEAGRPDDAELGTGSLIAFAVGAVLLGTWLATRIYWLRKAVLPRKRAGLGWEYNPIRFAKNVAKLREIKEIGDERGALQRRLRAQDAHEVEAFERWLSLKDADSYRAWRDCRAQEGV